MTDRPPYKRDFLQIRENVPADLMAIPQWMAWDYWWNAKLAKWDKPPRNAHNFKKTGATDSSGWAAFETAVATAEKHSVTAGVGFALRAGGGVVAIDLDNCIVDGIIQPHAIEVAETLNSYTEISPSGNGLRIVAWAEAEFEKTKFQNSTGGTYEFYRKERYVTLTGNRVDDYNYGIEHRHAEIAKMIADLSPGLEKSTARATPPAKEKRTAEVTTLVRAMITQKPKTGESDGSKRLYGWACRGVELNGTDEQIIQAIRAAATVHPFPSDWSDDDIRQRVRDAEGRVQRGNIDTERRNDRIELPSSAPNRLAETFIGTRYDLDGRSALARYNGEFHAYADGWAQKNDEALTAEIRGVADRIDVEKADKEGNPTGEYLPIRVSSSVVNEIKNACIRDDSMKYPTIVTGDRPQWLDGRTEPPAHRVIAFRNGLLNVDAWIAGRVELQPLTREWFGSFVCPFDFDPHAAAPDIWLQFVGHTWDNDDLSISLLRQWFGYVLTSDTSLQKMLLLIGPPRSGKGTIARVLAHLVGKMNVAAPTLASFATNFGLWPMIDKSLAIVGDARLSGRSDQAAVVERLLSLTGEDYITADKKNQQPVTLKFLVRLMLLTNELPRLNDASGALASRFIILQMHKSHLGREDPNLTANLIAESPGIILWALRGLRELYQAGHFIQSESVQSTMEELQDLSSPVRAFVRDCCEVQAGPRTAVSDIYSAWCWWCENEGREPGQKPLFARDIKSAFPMLKTSQMRLVGGDEDTRVRVLEGIRVKLAAEHMAKVREAANGR